jgi:hypothetical protein
MRGQAVVGWLYNSAGSSVLIAGLFHAMHNAIVNSTGLVAIVGYSQLTVVPCLVNGFRPRVGRRW